MKNLSNKMLYVNDDGEEIVIPLSRFLAGTALNTDTVVSLYFDSHVDGDFGNATMQINVTCTDSEAVLKTILKAFASSRDMILNLSNLHSNISAVEVAQESAFGSGAKSMSCGSGINYTGAAAAGTVYNVNISRDGMFIKTQIYIDIDGLNSGDTAKDVIGKEGEANCHIGQITNAVNGKILRGKMRCLETPTTGEPNIDLVESTLATITEESTAFDASGSSATLVAAAGDWTNSAEQEFTTLPTADRYLYLAAGDATNATYATGVFLIELWGVQV